MNVRENDKLRNIGRRIERRVWMNEIGELVKADPEFQPLVAKLMLAVMGKLSDEECFEEIPK